MVLTKEQREAFFNPDAMEEYFSEKVKLNKSIQTAIYNLLEVSRKIEKPLNKNLYDMSPEEYRDNLILLNEVTIWKVRFLTGFINDYNMWAFKAGKTANYFQVAKLLDFRNVDYSEIIKKQIIRNESDFEVYVKANLGFPSITNEDICPILLWAGVSNTDIGSIREVDVLQASNKIIYKGKYLSISRFLMDVLIRYMNQNCIETSTGVFYKSESPYVVKNIFKKKEKIHEYKDKKYLPAYTAKCIRDFCTKTNDRFDKEYSQETMVLSRNYWHIYEAADGTSDENIYNHIIGLDDVKTTTPTYIKDWQAGYDQYVNTYHRK